MKAYPQEVHRRGVLAFRELMPGIYNELSSIPEHQTLFTAAWRFTLAHCSGCIGDTLKTEFYGYLSACAASPQSSNPLFQFRLLAYCNICILDAVNEVLALCKVRQRSTHQSDVSDTTAARTHEDEPAQRPSSPRDAAAQPADNADALASASDPADDAQGAKALAGSATDDLQEPTMTESTIQPPTSQPTDSTPPQAIPQQPAQQQGAAAGSSSSDTSSSPRARRQPALQERVIYCLPPSRLGRKRSAAEAELPQPQQPAVKMTHSAVASEDGPGSVARRSASHQVELDL